MIQIGEVVETKTCFIPGQIDPKTQNPLPLGSIEIRLGGMQSQRGQVRNIFARPLHFNRRIPLIGEHVFVFSGPSVQTTSKEVKNNDYFYLSPINTTDDISFGHLPKIWERKRIPPLPEAPPPGFRLADLEIPGYTFPNPPKKIQSLQPYEGDDLFEGRFGQSIRFGSTVSSVTAPPGPGVYSIPPTWQGPPNTNGDPITIFRVRNFKSAPIKRVWSKVSGNKKFVDPNFYAVEDFLLDDSSIYMTSTQLLPTFAPANAFPKNLESNKVAAYNKAQVIVNSGQVVINSKFADSLFLSRKKSIIAGSKVILESTKYRVDLDELMDFLLEWFKSHKDIVMGIKPYATSAGPTAINPQASVDFNKIFARLLIHQNFKIPI